MHPYKEKSVPCYWMGFGLFFKAAVCIWSLFNSCSVITQSVKYLKMPYQKTPSGAAPSAQFSSEFYSGTEAEMGGGVRSCPVFTPSKKKIPALLPALTAAELREITPGTRSCTEQQHRAPGS